MPQFTVDDDVAALVERLAKKKPFEYLSFNDALRRVLQGKIVARDGNELEELLVETFRKKAPSPSAAEWAADVPELKSRKGLTSWKAICDFLDVEVGGDSARRRLKVWVSAHKPSWPPVPEI